MVLSVLVLYPYNEYVMVMELVEQNLAKSIKFGVWD